MMITLVGLRELWELRKQKKPLHEDWEEQARTYLRNKRRWVADLEERLKTDQKQLKEAELIVEALYAA